MKLNTTHSNRSFFISSLLLIFGISSSLSCFGQVQVFKQPFTNDTASVAKFKAKVDSIRTPRRFGRAAAEFGTLEVGVWAWDHFLKHADYSDISFATAKRNLNPGSWQFDQDPFTTNQFGHPFHGSQFYTSFRANGYTFWQAAPAAFAGSYLWETFGERDHPAPNDFINTGFGGIVLGETTYRLGNKLINNRHRGFRRQVEEVVALIINPVNGFNRILDGKWGKYSSNTTERDSSKVSGEFDLGFRKFGGNNAGLFDKGNMGLYLRGRLVYGTPYENYKTPFSNISITIEGGQDDSTKLNNISVYGSLTGWLLRDGNHIKHLLIISADYDYIHNVAFFYGGESVKANLYSEFKIDKDIKISTGVSAGPILLSAVPEPYIYNGRNYDYGSGLSGGVTAGINVADKLFFSASYKTGWSVTLNGNSSHYFLHNSTGEFSYMFIKHLSVAADGGYFSLNGYIKDKPKDNRSYPFLRTALRYSVNF